MQKVLLVCIYCISLFSFVQLPAQTKPSSNISKSWFESFSIRGYMQVRYNRLLETNPKLKCDQCDRSWGENGSFSIRRMRIIFSGQINERVFFYVQPDFASSVSATAGNVAQLRDAYMDIGLDSKNEFRIRAGQSKIPYGFENMQSSQNRIPLDRNDALNSSFTNERDLGVFFYWAPAKIRTLYASLVADGLKGSGDYGVFALGAFNGQIANRPEANNQTHFVTRFSYPFSYKNQIIEAGIQAYTGNYVLASDLISTGVKVNANRSYLDQRVAGSLTIYPKPFGIQAEYNIGKGPQFNKITDSIEVQNLSGGYITASYLTRIKKNIMVPFVRYQYYSGGKKHELDARSYEVKEFEIGIEWQPNKNFELVTMYTFSNRRFEDFRLQDNLQKGSLLRIQAQINF